jgi:hypothetical protein
MVHRPQSLWDTIEDVFTTTDDERVESARARVEREMFSTPEALAWAQSQGLNVAAQQRGPEGLRNEASRDSVLYSMINNFYSCDDNVENIRSRYREQGFDNGTTTKTYFFNMGPGTLGRGASNHESAMVVDESQNPPIITLNFRGSNLSGAPSAWREGAAGNNIFTQIFDMGMYLITGRIGNTPIPEWLSHFKGFMSYLTFVSAFSAADASVKNKSTGQTVDEAAASNAAKYTEPGGRIRLTAERVRDEAVLRVTDTGLGIAPLDPQPLARLAARQWTAGFNPRPVTEPDLASLYEAAR